MKQASIVGLIRLSIMIVALVGLCVCLFWYPYVTGKAYRWLQLAFYWVTSLPCFAILGIGWSLTGDIKKEQEFTVQTARKFLWVFYLLFADACLYLVGNLAFMLLRWNTFYAPIYLALGVMGLILSFFAYIVSLYIRKAQKIQEENDSIL